MKDERRVPRKPVFIVHHSDSGVATTYGGALVVSTES
jgi:hypothetical protein